MGDKTLLSVAHECVPRQEEGGDGGNGPCMDLEHEVVEVHAALARQGAVVEEEVHQQRLARAHLVGVGLGKMTSYGW
jgi:hypothetical protein